MKKKYLLTMAVVIVLFALGVIIASFEKKPAAFGNRESSQEVNLSQLANTSVSVQDRQNIICPITGATEHKVLGTVYDYSYSNISKMW